MVPDSSRAIANTQADAGIIPSSHFPYSPCPVYSRLRLEAVQLLALGAG